MNQLDPYQYTVRLPYHERFSSANVLQRPEQFVPNSFVDYPDVPTDLLVESDLLLTSYDRQRLQTTEDGDPMSGYRYNSNERLTLLADEKAATRLGVAHLERLDPFVLRVLRAQKLLASFVVRTRVDDASEFLANSASSLHLKQEADQPIGAYKLRGAAYKMLQLTEEQLKHGVYAASAGNHAQGVAYAAKELGVQATLVMPTTTPQIKVDGVRSYGAEVVLVGNSFEAASAYCRQLQVERPSATYIPPYDDLDVITGQATVAAEILQQYPEVTAIGVPVGGGGLLAGVAQYLSLVRPDVRIYGIEPKGSSAMTTSLRAGLRVVLKDVDTFADGVAVAQVGKTTFKAAARYVGKDNMVVVKKRALAQAVVDLNHSGLRTEPAGALSLAGLRQVILSDRQTHNFVAIRSGSNIDPSKLREAEKLASA